MNKLKFIVIAICAVVLASCSEKDIEPFGTSSYVYFDKFWKDASFPGTEKADTTHVTFFFADDSDEYVLADLKVILAGRKPEKDLNIKLKVVADMTTAEPNEYSIDEFYTFRAREIEEDATQIEDIIKIKINRSKRLETIKGFYLGLEIVPTEDLLVGQYERSKAVLFITKDPVKPVWWDREVQEELLGVYSPKKYKLFLLNVPGSEKIDAEMIKTSPDRVRKLVLDFKKWLSNNPSYDDNGYLITVNV